MVQPNPGQCRGIYIYNYYYCASFCYYYYYYVIGIIVFVVIIIVLLFVVVNSLLFLGIRIETKVYSRLERQTPHHSSPHELLGVELSRSGNEFGPDSQYGLLFIILYCCLSLLLLLYPYLYL